MRFTPSFPARVSVVAVTYLVHFRPFFALTHFVPLRRPRLAFWNTRLTFAASLRLKRMRAPFAAAAAASSGVNLLGSIANLVGEMARPPRTGATVSPGPGPGPGAAAVVNWPSSPAAVAP